MSVSSSLVIFVNNSFFFVSSVLPVVFCGSVLSLKTV